MKTIRPCLPLCLSAWAFILSAAVVPAMSASDVGRRFPSEMRTLVDAVTGVPIVALTTGPANDSKIYQTHPQWAADGRHIVFRSNRAPDKKSQAFAVDEATGTIIQLTDGPDTGTGSLNLARKTNKLYFLRGGMGVPVKLIELDLGRLFADSEAEKVGEAETYERAVVTLPPDVRESGGFALDADERVAYLGMRILTEDEMQGKRPPPRGAGEPTRPVSGGIRRIDLGTGEIKTVVDTPFRMGHVQANPWVAGEILYCNETGGDAEQRMWMVHADGTGNRPLYVEGPDDWVTHEVFVGRDEVMFSLLGHQEKLRKRPSGIAVINLRNDQMRIIGQLEAGRGLWHCNGSPDGRWAAADTFDGNIYLIERASGAMTLLSTDHKMRPDHAHPAFSPDSKRVIIQSGLLSDGKSLDVMVIAIPEALLKGR